MLLVVSFLTYALLEFAPSDAAFTLLAGEEASAEQIATLRHELGLDKPLAVRYLSFLSGAVLHGDLGQSIMSGRDVSELLGERFVNTLILTLMATVLSLSIGTLAGILAAARPGSFLEAGVMFFVIVGLALPTFWVALLMIMVFSLHLGWLPVVGAGTWTHMVLPTVSLALPTTAVVARLVRASVLDVKGADHVRTARSKGLDSRQTWQYHILRNSMIPVITLIGLHLGHLLSGTFIIETIFGWPGLGRLVVQAIFDRDLPVVVGAVILIAVIFQILNLAVDVAHARLDPRVGREAL